MAPPTTEPRDRATPPSRARQQSRSPVVPRPVFVALFAVCAALLTIGTHWPRLQIEGPIPRPDLYIHLAAWSLAALLLALSGLAGWATTRTGAGRVWIIALVWCTADELTQAIPELGRTVALDDWLMNAAGVSLGTLAAAGAYRTPLLGRWLPSPGPGRKEGSHTG